MSARPLVGISGCTKSINERGWHAAAVKYSEAALHAVGAMPLVIPPVGSIAFAGEQGRATLDNLLGRLDGLILTGSPSNVEPHHYGQPSRDGTLHDGDRDSTTLPLIRRAIELAVPIFAICRGLQEVNVALGGSLHQHVHEREDRSDHRSPRSRNPEIRDPDVNYGPAHPVAISPGGLLAALIGKPEIDVNSLHGQGIDQLAAPLAVEAVAPDGQIEAVSHRSAPGFFFAVQWHPEHRALENWVSMRLFGAFGEAVRRRAAGSAPGALPLAAE